VRILGVVLALVSAGLLFGVIHGDAPCVLVVPSLLLGTLAIPLALPRREDEAPHTF